MSIKISKQKKKYLSNIFWSLSGKFVNVLSSLFVGILVVRYLGPEQYGIMNYVISFVGLFTILSNFGLDNIEVRELSKSSQDRTTIIGTAFYLRIFLAIFTIIIVSIIVFLHETDLNIQIFILIYSLSMVLSSFNIIRNYFTAIVENKYIVKAEILRIFLGALLKIVLILLHADLLWFIIALTFDFLLIAGGYLYSYKSKNGHFSNLHFDKITAFYLLKQSFPLMLSGAAVIIYQRIDQVMIGNMINKTSVGYFSAASKFTELILYLPTIISTTLTPKLVQSLEIGREIYEKHRQIYSNLIVWSSLLMAIFVSISAYWLIYLTYGVNYISAVPVLQIMAFKAVGMALASSSGSMIVIEGLQKYAMFRNVLGCIICIGLNYVFIPVYGIVGSAVVTIITVFVSGYIAHLIIRPFHEIFIVQTKSILFGWKDIPYIIKNLNK